MRIIVLGVFLTAALLLGTMVEINTVLAKMPANASTNPDVLKVELNQSGSLFFLMIYHDQQAGYWDISFTGKELTWDGDVKNMLGSVSFPDSEVNRFEVPS